MGSNWKTTTLGEIALDKDGAVDGPFGSNLPASCYVDVGIPVIRGSNLSKGLDEFKDEGFVFVTDEIANKLSRSKCIAEDIIFTKKGTLGQTGIVRAEHKYPVYLLSSNQMRLRVDSTKAIPEYVYYWVSSKRSITKLLKDSECTGVPKINLAYLKSFPIDLPCVNEQQKIIDILNSINSKIQLNQKTNQTLEQMAHALFKSWFVDFDPVFDNLLASVDFKLENLENRLPDELKQKAQRRLAALNSLENATQCKASLSALANELQAQLPTKEATQAAEQVSGKAAKTPVKPNFNANPKVLAQHASTHAHFPNEFEHNKQLGWIPKGWSASSVEDEFVVKGGSTPSTKNPDFWEGGEIHWTSPKDLSGNTTKIMLDTSRKITSAGLKKITSGLLPIDTVLMSSRAPVGYLALAKVPVAINQGYIAITDAQTLSSEYTIQWLDSVMDEIKGISGGTTFAEISKKTFKSIQLVIPSKKAVEAYTEVTKMYYERITACVQEINTLTETRDYLLPKLISGELQIPDVATDDETVD